MSSVVTGALNNFTLQAGGLRYGRSVVRKSGERRTNDDGRIAHEMFVGLYSGNDAFGAPAGAAVIETADLGTWGRAALLAEYDAEDDVIRVNVRAVERVRNLLGDAEVERFIACAVAHERYHRAHPGATEDDAHRFAAAECGVDPRRFEALFLKK